MAGNRRGASPGKRGAGAGRKGAPRGRQPAAAGGAPAARDTSRAARPPRPADPRRTAYDVLAAVRERGAYANLLLPSLLAERHLAGRDAALTTELTYGTLRGQGSYDAVLAACSDRPLAKLDPPVLDVLRLGTHQLLNTRVGAHAAVATSVDLAKRVAGPHVSGYVNAVLRRVSTRDLPAWLDIVAPEKDAGQDRYLSVRYSHPAWIVAAYRQALGPVADTAATPLAPVADAPADSAASPAATPVVPPASDPADSAVSPAAATPPAPLVTEASSTPPAALDAAEPDSAAVAGGVPVTELEAALAAGNARPRVTMAAFPGGAPRADVMPPTAEPGRWSPYAFTLASGDPTPLIESGAAAVQDEGSQLAAIALSRAPLAGPGLEGDRPERWLDLCAGPGGKTRLLAGLAQDSDEGRRAPRLVAAELHPHRAALVAQALSQAPGARAAVVTADATRPAWADGAFDRVLADVPCTGLGALRRRPEARWRKTEADLPGLAALQRALLRSALAAARPGGVVAYVTCSPLPAETSDVVTDVAGSVPGTEILDAPDLLSQVPGTRSPHGPFVQLWPHRHGTDAMFIALLRRAA